MSESMWTLTTLDLYSPVLLFLIHLVLEELHAAQSVILNINNISPGYLVIYGDYYS